MLNFSKKVCFTILLMQSCFGLAEVSQPVEIPEASSQQDGQQAITNEFETYINYWAFNGSTVKDQSIIVELIESASDLSEAIGLGKAEEIKELMLKDSLAQGGPNVILSQRTIPIIKDGVMKAQFGPVNRFLNSLNKVNPKLSSVANQFTNFVQGKSFSVDSSLMVPMDTRIQCLRNCAVKFLGLQNNNTFLQMLKMKSYPSFGLKQSNEMEEIRYRFPSENSSKREKIYQNGKFNPALASTRDAQNACSSSCMREIWTHAIQGATLGITLGAAGGAVGMGSGAAAGAAVGAAVGTGICSLCDRNNDREERIKEKELELRERELALKEKELRNKEQAEKIGKEEIEKENLKAKLKREESEREAAEKEKKTREIQQELEKGNWADRRKNKEAKDDSSVSCTAMRTCDGTMNAFKAPNEVDKQNGEQVDPAELLRRKREMTSMPVSPDIDSEHKANVDLNEWIRLKKEITSTPIQNHEKVHGEPEPIMFDNKPVDWEMPSVGKFPINKDIVSKSHGRLNRIKR